MIKRLRILAGPNGSGKTSINVGRVRTRVLEGGHDVQEDKIRSRYFRSLDNVYEAIRQSDRAYLFDNSGMKYEWIAEYDASDGSFDVRIETSWLQNAVLNKM